jgi:hypothetical protein
MRVFYGTAALMVCWLLYFSLSNVLDREGVTGALLSPSGQSAFGFFVLFVTIALRFACVIVLPGLLAGWMLSRIGQRLALRFRRTD